MIKRWNVHHFHNRNLDDPLPHNKIGMIEIEEMFYQAEDAMAGDPAADDGMLVTRNSSLIATWYASAISMLPKLLFIARQCSIADHSFVGGYAKACLEELESLWTNGLHEAEKEWIEKCMRIGNLTTPEKTTDPEL